MSCQTFLCSFSAWAENAGMMHKKLESIGQDNERWKIAPHHNSVTQRRKMVLEDLDGVGCWKNHVIAKKGENFDRPKLQISCRQEKSIVFLDHIPTTTLNFPNFFGQAMFFYICRYQETRSFTLYFSQQLYTLEKKTFIQYILLYIF